MIKPFLQIMIPLASIFGVVEVYAKDIRYVYWAIRNIVWKLKF